MKVIPIDDYIEALEKGRGPAPPPIRRRAAGEWGRLVAEGREARWAADGGRWHIGRLSGLVEKRYGAGALQRFAEEIGESYSTVRRHRWVVARYDSAARFRFPSLSFSHFQAVARFPDRVSWLARAERGGWSVDHLVRRSQADESSEGTSSDGRLDALIEAMRRQLVRLSDVGQRSLTPDGRARIAWVLADLMAEIRALQERLHLPEAPAAPRRSRRASHGRATSGSLR